MASSATSLSETILRFIVVGTSAAGVHLGMVALLFHAGLHPLIANVFAFVTAFHVSYAGHRFLTFPGSRLSYAASLHRFGWVAVTSFLANEGLYALLLRFTALDYLLSLLLVLAVVTPFTFILSRRWAFR